MTEKDIVLIYDNCPCHNGIISGWYMRSLPCIKITICPYTPEFNPHRVVIQQFEMESSGWCNKEQKFGACRVFSLEYELDQ